MLALLPLRESKTLSFMLTKACLCINHFCSHCYKTDDVGKGLKHRMTCKAAHTMFLQLDREYVTDDFLSTYQL